MQVKRREGDGTHLAAPGHHQGIPKPQGPAPSRQSLHLAPRAHLESLRRPRIGGRGTGVPEEQDVHPDVVAQAEAVEVDVDLVHHPEVLGATFLRPDDGPVVVQSQCGSADGRAISSPSANDNGYTQGKSEK